MSSSNGISIISLTVLLILGEVLDCIPAAISKVERRNIGLVVREDLPDRLRGKESASLKFDCLLRSHRLAGGESGGAKGTGSSTCSSSIGPS